VTTFLCIEVTARSRLKALLKISVKKWFLGQISQKNLKNWNPETVPTVKKAAFSFSEFQFLSPRFQQKTHAMPTPTTQNLIGEISVGFSVALQAQLPAFSVEVVHQKVLQDIHRVITKLRI